MWPLSANPRVCEEWPRCSGQACDNFKQPWATKHGQCTKKIFRQIDYLCWMDFLYRLPASSNEQKRNVWPNCRHHHSDELSCWNCLPSLGHYLPAFPLFSFFLPPLFPGTDTSPPYRWEIVFLSVKVGAKKSLLRYVSDFSGKVGKPWLSNGSFSGPLGLSTWCKEPVLRYHWTTYPNMDQPRIHSPTEAQPIRFCGILPLKEPQFPNHPNWE